MEYDIIVCGGGVSGVCAAISAARYGARVLLIEQENCLGGTWTSGLIAWMLDVKQKKEQLVNEIIKRLERAGEGRFARGGAFLFEPEAMKRLLDELCMEAGVEVRFHTFFCGILKQGSYVRAVQTVSKSGKETFCGRYFVDATGDGDVCAACGAEYMIGNDEGKAQPMSMFAIVDGLKQEELEEFDNSLEYSQDLTPKQKLRAELVRAGFAPSQQEPGMYYLYNDVFLLTMNHVYGVLGTSAEDLTKATMLARAEINAAVNALRGLGGIWSNIRLVSTAPSIGVREGRRIVGKYMLTREDVINCRHFDDSICDACFCIDIHALSKENKLPYEAESEEVERHYQIPLRAAECKGIDNLFMTGRCISGDFFAHASYRVSGNAAVIGENIGKYIAKKVR